MSRRGIRQCRTSGRSSSGLQWEVWGYCRHLVSVSVGALSGAVWRTNFIVGDYLPSTHTPLPAALSTPFKLTPLTLILKQLRKYYTLQYCSFRGIWIPLISYEFYIFSVKPNRKKHYPEQVWCKARQSERMRDLVISMPQREEARRPLRSRPAWEHKTLALPPHTTFNTGGSLLSLSCFLRFFVPGPHVSCGESSAVLVQVLRLAPPRPAFSHHWFPFTFHWSEINPLLLAAITM